MSVITYRILTQNWLYDYHFDLLLKVFEKYKDCIDEICLIDANTHMPFPIEYYKELQPILRDRIKRIKDLGITCGINHLSTIGHINENDRFSLKDSDCIVDCIGDTAKTLCMNSEKNRVYKREVFKIIADTGTDFLWIDDDFKLNGHTLTGVFGCFCPKCLEKFGKSIGVENMSMDKFHELTCAPNSDKLNYRKAWLKFNEDTIVSFHKLIREAVDSVDPNIIIGQMSSEQIYSNCGYKSFSKVMSKNNTMPTKWRPGGAFYKDWDKCGLYEKSAQLGRQVCEYPDYVTNIQGEIENFPYHYIQKSTKMNVLETCAYIGVGCEGTAINFSYTPGEKSTYDSASEFEPYFKNVLAKKPFFDLLTEKFKRNANNGIFVNQTNLTTFLSMQWNEGKWIGGADKNSNNWLVGGTPQMSNETFELGLPMAFSRNKSYVTYLTYDGFYSLTNEEILDILKGGLVIDGKALETLIDMGYGEYLGFKVVDKIMDDGNEVFNSHKLNGEFSGYIRDARQSFKWWIKPAYALEKTNEKSEFLAYLTDYSYEDFNGKKYGAVGVFENSLGGRICVLGYYPDTFVQCTGKARQLKNIMKYLSKDKINYVDSYHNILFYDRSCEKTAFLLINNSYDDAENVRIAVAKDIEKINVSDMELNTKEIKRVSFADNYSYFEINIKSFDCVAMYE